MIFVVDSIYVASNTPKRLEPLAQEIRKAVHHAFPDKEALDWFIGTYRFRRVRYSLRSPFQH